MKSGLTPLAVVSLMLWVAPEVLAQTVVAGNTKLPVIQHGPYLISQVYEVEPGNYGPISDKYSNPDGISPNRCFRGTQQTVENVRVVPGVLCLDTDDKFALNVAAFATCPPDAVGEPYVQSFRLIKKVPGSKKAICYGDPRNPPTYYQFGAKGVRTWWTLKYTQPGTTFCLELTVRCMKRVGRVLRPTLHIDQWIWKVAVTPEDFPNVIDMLHSTPLSVLEIPCIADEGVYRKLKQLAYEFKAAVESDASLYKKQEAFFALEMYIFQQCMHVDWFFPAYIDPDNPYGFEMSKVPGNFPTTSPSTYGGGTGNWSPHYGEYKDEPDGGIVDSFEDPCCCKLIADVEFLGAQFGITTP